MDRVGKFAEFNELGAAVFHAEAELKINLFQAASNDPMLEQQPHYPAINLFEAWEIAGHGSPNVVVQVRAPASIGSGSRRRRGAAADRPRDESAAPQVLDTGIDVNHPDLQHNIWQNPGEICGNGIDDDGNGFVDDCNGYNHADDTGNDLLGSHWHGTHCGGTIAADTDNGVGVAGVAGGARPERRPSDDPRRRRDMGSGTIRGAAATRHDPRRRRDPSRSAQVRSRTTRRAPSS